MKKNFNKGTHSKKLYYATIIILLLWIVMDSIAPTCYTTYSYSVFHYPVCNGMSIIENIGYVALSVILFVGSIILIVLFAIKIWLKQ